MRWLYFPVRFCQESIWTGCYHGRFNLYTSIKVMVSCQWLYFGQALQAIAEVAKNLPTGYGYELGYGS